MKYKTLNKKGQGAMEYLLIIGGAVLVAIVAISIIISISNKNSSKVSDKNEEYEKFIDSTIVPPIIISCTKIPAKISMVFNKSPSLGVTEYCLYVNGNYTGTCTKPSGLNEIDINYNTGGLEIDVALSARKDDGSISQPSTPSIKCVSK